MATFFERLIAYAIDMFIVTLIISLVCSGLPNTSEKVSEKMTELQNQVTSGEMSMDVYLEEYQELLYDYQKANILFTGVNIASYIAYFVIFQTMTKGQTLGKKLLKIKVVDEKNKKEVSFIQIMLRSLFTLNIFSLSLSAILLYILNKNTYVNVYSIITVVETIFIIVTIFFILYKKNKRGLHDIMAGTSVIKER